MGSKIDRQIKRAKELEQKITKFRSNKIAGPVRRNAFDELSEHVKEITKFYEEAFSIYCKLAKKGDESIQSEMRANTERLLDDFLDYVGTYNWNSSSMALHLLLPIDKNRLQLERLIPGTTQKLYQTLQKAIHHNLSQHIWVELPTINEAIRIMKNLAGDTPADQNTYGVRLCYLIDLIVSTCITDFTIVEHPTDQQGQLANAIHWLDEGTRIAQSIDMGWAEKFASRASELRQLLHKLPPEPLFSAPLSAAIAQSTREQHQESFLPSLTEFQEEFSSVKNKLEQLLSDERLLLNDSRIEAWVEEHPDSPLKEALTGEGARVIDANANRLDSLDVNQEFKIQYVTEIEQNIGTLFGIWKETGDLTIEMVMNLLNIGFPKYDWKLFEVGLTQYFQHSEYISASHLLITQFEGVTVSWARNRGIAKKVRQGEPGELYLSDLVKKQEFQEAVGNDLSELIFWYMVNRDATEFNCRNNIAHGFVIATMYNWEYVSAMAIWLTLKVIGNSNPN